MDNIEAVETLAEALSHIAPTGMSGTIIAKEILAAIQADPLAYVKPKPQPKPTAMKC